MYVHTTPVKTEDSKTWDKFQFGLLVPGRREGREGFWPDPTLTICKSLSWHPSQASWSSLPRLMKQNLTKTASPATLHAAAWIANLTRLWIYWWHLTTQRIATSPVPVHQCKRMSAGWPSSKQYGSLLCVPWASPRIYTAPCRALLASSREYFIFQDPGFPRYKFKFLAKPCISLYYINERCTETFLWDTAYCSLVVPVFVEGKS